VFHGWHSADLSPTYRSSIEEQWTRSLFAVAVVQMLVTLLPLPARASEGYFYQGFSAFSASFYLIGGQYELYVNAPLGQAPNGLPRMLSKVFKDGRTRFSSLGVARTKSGDLYDGAVLDTQKHRCAAKPQGWFSHYFAC
jgi:hypothetical protein